MKPAKLNEVRKSSFGTYKLSLIDRFGIWLSRRAILKEIEDRKNLAVLELGCGYLARNLLAIEDRANNIVGVDFNLSDQVKCHPKFKAMESSIEDAMVNLQGQKFDLIMIISVLEHLYDPVQIINFCQKSLNPGGVLLINVPTWFGKIFLEFSAFRLGLSPAEEMNDHKMYYDKRDLWPLLVKGGFLPSGIKMRYHKFRMNLFSSARQESL